MIRIVLASAVSIVNLSITSGATPTFVQTKWFCILLGVAIVAIWHGLRVRQLAGRLQKERLTVRLIERQRIARELHDTLLQGFQGLILRLEAVNRLLPTGEARTQLQRALESMDALLVEGRDCLKEIRSSMETITSLEHNFSLIAEEMVHTSGAKLRISIEGRPEPVHPDVREEVYRIGREALVNAFRHAGATEIEVTLVYSKGEFRAHIRDNGRGMDPEALKSGNRLGHWGISGMYERTVNIGGRMNIRSSPSSGTEVELTVPGNVAYRGEGRRSLRLRSAAKLAA
jgi:signal transduction histidine kinase